MRNNEQRLEVEKLSNVEKLEELEQPKVLEFVVPKEFVELPSSGKYYPEEHPYRDKSEIEIYYATAKENDILTSQTLIEKGLVFDKLIESVLVRKVDARKLLDCDRKSILIQVRKSGFDSTYKTSMICKKCGNPTTVNVDLNEHVKINVGLEKLENVKDLNDGTFSVILPRTKIKVNIRFLNGEDENVLFENNKKRKKNKKSEKFFTDRLKQMITSVNDNNSKVYISDFCNHVSLLEANYLFDVYRKICPNIKIESVYECECGNDGTVEVPINVDFFWPDNGE